ncbi:MAG: MGMT family protein [Verrucomicrobia bacterium]|nr:MGMT family protein [Verrucomicrobiota bacterium]
MDHWFGRKGRHGGRWDEDFERDYAFQRAILAIPAGKVSTYGKVAEAAGYPRYHRAVARLLSGEHFDRLPWHRVVGADGAIKTPGASAKEQRARLRREGVSFRGKRVDLSVSLHRPGKRAGIMTEE